MITATVIPIAGALPLPVDDAMAQQAPHLTDALVAFFSRSGNTKLVAHHIRLTKSAMLFEIMPAEPYPEHYQQTVDQAGREDNEGFEPRLKERVADIRSYKAIYLGFPIWGMTAPPIIRSFLRAHDISGMTVIPFITHGGYGVGRSLDVLNEHAPQAHIQSAFVQEADQERRTAEQVAAWLGG